MDLRLVNHYPIRYRNSKSEVSSEDRKVCLLCFCLCKLDLVTTSPFAEEFNNFNFIEKQIGYALPECICTTCLDKLNEMALFINMCKESREKYLKLVELTRPQITEKRCKQEKTSESEVEIIDEVGEIDESNHTVTIVDDADEIIDECNETVEIIDEENETEIEEADESKYFCNDSVDKTQEAEKEPTENGMIDESIHNWIVDDPTESIIAEEPTESVEPPVKKINIDDIASDHSYHVLEKETDRRKVKICPECNESVTRYVDHYKQSPSCKPRNVSCSMCTLKFENSALLYSHQVVNHSDKIPIVPFVCHLCAQTFTYKGNLQRHLRIHENSKRFICEHCGKGYTSKVQLQEHALTHLNIKPYLCNKCGKQFSTRKMLYTHERAHKINAEAENESNVCKICNRSFSRRGLKVHMHTHAKDKIYKCPKCDEEFESTKLYRRHVRTHPKKFDVCPRCSKRVARYTLKQHLRTHSEERPFVCTECDKKFRTRAHLEYHLTAIHNAHGTVPHECSYCRKFFASKGTLEKHEMIHNGEDRKKPYKCKICDKAFTCLKGRKRHITRVHGQHEEIVYKK